MSQQLKVFPSNLADDWGRVLTEKNVKTILNILQTNNKYTHNAVISGFQISEPFDNSSQSLQISGGQALFNGYQVEALNSSYTILYPNNPLPVNLDDAKYFYLCLHLKYTTGNDAIKDFVVYEDYQDFNKTTLGEGNIYLSTSESNGNDSPFILIEYDGTEPYGTNTVIKNLGITEFEEGYDYYYHVLFAITIRNTSDGYVVDVQDGRDRDFQPLHETTVGYLGGEEDINTVLDTYFGYSDEDKIDDWRRKYVITKSGSLENSLEKVLFDYMRFIHEEVRGYKTQESAGGKSYNLKDINCPITSSNRSINWENTWGSFSTGDDTPPQDTPDIGIYLPIQNTIVYRDSIIAHLSFYPDEIVDEIYLSGNPTVGGTKARYINEMIVRHSFEHTTNEKNNVMDYEGGEYEYTNPTGESSPLEKSYGVDYLVTLNNLGKISKEFLPHSEATIGDTLGTAGLISLDIQYYPGATATTHSSDSEEESTTPIDYLFEYDEYGKVKCYASRYGFTSISADGVTVHDLTVNNAQLNIIGSLNRMDLPVILSTMTLANDDTNNVSITLTNPNPVNTAYALFYDEDFQYEDGEYTINQHLRTSDTPHFVNLILDGGEDEDHNLIPAKLVTDYIVPNDGNTQVTIGSDEAGNHIDLVVTGNINADKVYSAVYNDYAELFKKSNVDQHFEPGDVIAKSLDGDGYELATPDHKNNVVGVYSDTYGHLLGGDENVSLEDNLKTHIPVGLCGRVKVKLVGIANIGDYITMSEIPGVAKATSIYKPGEIIGKAIENKSTESEDLINMMIMLG